jgi:hypothetical protein
MTRQDPHAPLADQIASRPWSDIQEFYRDLVCERGFEELRPLLDFVERLSSSRYAAGLFGATSHTDLLLAQTEKFRWDRESLRISCRGAAFTFTFVETVSAAPWVRQYPADRGFSAFENFVVKLKHWFPSER